MTLITVGNSEGDRRCDSRCYDAKGERCTCVCGGRNHGVGLERARENILDHGERIADEWAVEHPDELVIFKLVQEELFK